MYFLLPIRFLNVHKAMNVVSGKYFIFCKQVNIRYFTFINCFAFKSVTHLSIAVNHAYPIHM